MKQKKELFLYKKSNWKMLVKTKIEEKAQKIYKDECEKRKKLKCFTQKKNNKKTKNKKQKKRE